MIGLPIAIIGAGGHAMVVADALLAAGHRISCFLDVGPDQIDASRLGIAVHSQAQYLRDQAHDAILLANGIGGVRGTALRRRVQEELEADGWVFANVQHPTAIVSPFAVLDAGVQLLAGAIVQPGARIGRGAIINTRALIEHDCDVGPWCHIAPAATVCGEVRTGEGCHVGAGAVIRQQTFLGPNTLVGAGAVVVRDFAGNVALAGVPARALDKR